MKREGAMVWTKGLLVTPAGAAENVKMGTPSLALTMIRYPRLWPRRKVFLNGKVSTSTVFKGIAVRFASFISLLIVLFFAWTPTKAQDSPYMPGAKGEGEVVFYVSAALTTGVAVAKAFENRYPFLKVQIYRTSGENMVNKITTEKRAGKVLFDLVYGAAVPFLPPLGVLQPYASAAAAAYPAMFRDASGMWVGVSANYYVLGYNTRLVPRDDVPKSWDDLLNPKWRRQIAMDPEEFTWLGAMEESLGAEKSRKFMTSLAQQEIQWRKNHTTLAQFMAAGEYPIALVYAHNVEAMKENGAGVEWVKTTKPLVVDLKSVGLSAKPPHPNAARLFFDFILSTQGQKAILQDKKIPLRPGILPQNSPLNPSALELYPTPPKVYRDLNQYAEKFEKYFGPRR